MQKHAGTHLADDEAARLLVAALNDLGSGGWATDQATAIGRIEMLGRWSTDTPEGPLHRVAVVRVIDAEPMGFDEYYRDEAEAAAVWGHLAAEAGAQRE